MIKFTHKGDFQNTEGLFKRVKQARYLRALELYGQMGVEALASATPVETGKTASSWGYEVAKTKTGYALRFTNDNVEDGLNIAVLLQYGHGTRTGGYVQGIDYINPAIRPIFEAIAQDAWKEVTA